MLKKTKRVISLACVLICILPMISYSMDKEEFLRMMDEMYSMLNSELGKKK